MTKFYTHTKQNGKVISSVYFNLLFFDSKLEDKGKIKGPGTVPVHNPPHTLWETPGGVLKRENKNVLFKEASTAALLHMADGHFLFG